MSMIEEFISDSGPLVDVQVNVSPQRAQFLRTRGLPVPEPVYVRGLIDTGATLSGFSRRVFDALSLQPIGEVPTLTPSTPSDQPFITDLYHIDLALVANGSAHRFGPVKVIVADGWHPNEEPECLIGRDVLTRCHFFYYGPDNKFALAIV